MTSGGNREMSSSWKEITVRAGNWVQQRDLAGAPCISVLSSFNLLHAVQFVNRSVTDTAATRINRGFSSLSGISVHFNCNFRASAYIVTIQASSFLYDGACDL